MEALFSADIVFADPDNGLTTDDESRRLLPGFGKQIPLKEALALGGHRPVVVYHHNSRFKGGHDAEVDHWMQSLGRPAVAVRCNAFSCRTFFVIDPDPQTSARVIEFGSRWRDNGVRLHQAGPPIMEARTASSLTLPLDVA